MTSFAKPSLLSRLRSRVCACGVPAWALLLAVALVASGFLAATQDAATAGGHCEDHVTAMDAGTAQNQHAAHAEGCCGEMCACACTHAIASVPLLVLRFAAPAVRMIAFSSPSVRPARAAPPLRPPIA
jgi:hypothetical protein